MADKEDLVKIDFDTGPAKKSLDNLVKYVVRIQKKFEAIKIKFQVDQKSWDRVKTQLEKKASKLKDVTIALKVSPPTKGNVEEARKGTNALLKDILLSPISLRVNPATKANIDAAVVATNALVQAKTLSPIKVGITFTKGAVNTFFSQLKQTVGGKASNVLPINLSVQKGRGKQTLTGVAADFDKASTAKDKFYNNVRTVFPKLEQYFIDLGLAASVATTRLMQFFKKTGQQLNTLKGTARALAKMSTIKIGDEKTFSAFDKLQGMGNKLRLFAFDFYILGNAIVNGLVQPLVASTKAFRLFEQNMKNAQVLSGATDVEFSNIERTLDKLSSTTRYTKGNLSELVDEFARAGLNAASIEASLKSVVDLSDAIGKAGVSNAENLRNAYQTLTDAYFGFKKQYDGLSQEDAFKKISNSIASAANASKADLQDFGYFMNQVVASAVQANLKLDDTVSLFATLKQVMPSGRMASSALNQAIVQLSTFPSEKEFDGIVERLKAIGLTADDINPSIVDLKTAMDNIFKIRPTQNEIFKIFGTEGSRVPSLIRNLGDEYDRISKEVASYSNTLLNLNSVEQIANKTRQTANYSIEVLISNFENLKIEIGKILAELIAYYEHGIKGVIKATQEWVSENKQLIGTIIKWGALITSSTLALYGLGIALQFVFKALMMVRLAHVAVLRVMRVLYGVVILATASAIGMFNKSVITFAMTMTGFSRTTVVVIARLILFAGTLNMVHLAAIRAALGISIAQAAAGGLAALIVGGAIVAGVMYLIKQFNDLNTTLKTGAGIIPSYSDQIEGINEEFSDGAVKLKTYNNELLKQIEAQKQLIALRNSSKPLTEEQQKIKSDLEGKAMDSSTLTKSMEYIDNEVTKLRVRLNNSVNESVKVSIQKQIDSLLDTKTKLKMLFDAETGKYESAITESAAVQQTQVIGKLKKLTEKFSKEGLDTKEFQEYVDLMAQYDYILKQLEGKPDFIPALTAKNEDVQNTVKVMDDLKELIKLATENDDIDSTGFKEGRNDDFWGGGSSVWTSVLDRRDKLDGEFKALLKALPTNIDDVIPGFSDYAKNGPTKEFLDYLENLNLDPVIQKSTELQLLIAAVKDARKDYDEVIKPTRGKEGEDGTVKSFLTSKNQEGLNKWQSNVGEITSEINEALNSGLTESVKKTKAINDEFDKSKGILSDKNDLIRVSLDGIQEQTDLVNSLNVDDEKKKEQLKVLEFLKNGLLDYQAKVTSGLLAVEERRTEELAAQREELYQQNMEKEKLAQEEERNLKSDTLKLSGNEKEIELAELDTKFDADIKRLRESRNDLNATAEEKEHYNKLILQRTANYEKEISLIDDKYEKEKAAYLKEIALKQQQSDKTQAVNLKVQELEEEHTKALEELKKQQLLTDEERAAAKAKIDATYINNVKNLNAEMEKQAKLEKESAQIENMRLKNQNRVADLTEAQNKFNADVANSEEQIRDAKTDKEKQAYQEELDLLKENYRLTRDQINKKYELENEEYLKQLKIDALSLNENTKHAADVLKIEDDYIKDKEELAAKKELNAQQRADALVQIENKKANALANLNTVSLDDDRSTRLAFVDSFYDDKISKIEEEIDKAKSNRANSRTIDNLEKQKEELEKQKQIWTRIVQDGGKFDLEMSQALDYMKAMKIETNRIDKAQRKLQDNLQRLAKAQHAYNQHLKMYNALKAAGKDVSRFDKLFMQDKASIEGWKSRIQKDSTDLGVSVDTAAITTGTETEVLRQQALITSVTDSIKQQITAAIEGVGDAAGALGREFFNSLTYWFPIILDSASQFVKLLSFILDPTKPKSPPITTVVSKGVDIIGAEFGRLNDIELSDNLKKNFSGLNLENVIPQTNIVPEVNIPTAQSSSNKTLTDASTVNYNIKTDFDKQEMVRQLNNVNRKRQNRLGF